jgi:hypothetical protein
MAKEFEIPGLKEVLNNLEKLNTQVKKNAKDFLDMAVNADKAMKAVGKVDGLKDYVALQKSAKTETDKVEVARQKLIKAQSDEGKELVKLNLLIQQQNQANKASADVTNQLNESLKNEIKTITDARAQNALLTQARNNLDLSTQQGRENLKTYNDLLDKNNAFIKNNADATLKQKMSIGDYATGMQTAIENTGLFQGKLGDVTRTAIGFIQGGAQAVQKIEDLNKSVVNGAKNAASYVTSKLGFIQTEKASTVAIEAETIATEENAVANAEAKVATIGFTQSQKAASIATEANTLVTEGNAVAAEGMAVAQLGVAATSEVMAVAEVEATVATTALDVALGVLLSPVTLVVAAVGLLFFIFKDFAPIINPIKDAFAALMAVFNVLKQDIFDLVTGARSLGDIFSSFGDDTSKAAKSAMELAQATRDLNKAMDINEVSMAQSKTRIQELILQSKNRTLSEKERVKLIQEAQDIEEKAFKKTNDLNNEAIRISREKLFEGKHLSEEEKKFIEANDFAKIRSLKIAKNLDEDELKSYADLLKKKESLLQEDQQIREKAENRKDQLADKAKEKAEKEAEKAKKDADEAQKRADEAVKKEIERRKKEADIAISTMKTTLDYQIATYEQENNLMDDNISHVQAISLMKQKIADAEAQKELIGLNKNSVEAKAILQKKADEYQKIEIEKNKAILDIQKENVKFELELYDFKNQTLLKDGATINDLLIEQEKNRLDKEYQMHKESLEKLYGLDAEKVKEKEKTNKKLTDAEFKFLKELKSAEDKKDTEKKKSDKLLLDTKLKSIATEEKKEVRKFKLLQKTSQANNLFELKAKAKALKEEQKLYKDDAKKQDEINDALTANKQEQEKIVSQSKKKQLMDGLDAVINVAGQESEIGKATAIAKTTINTYEAASAILKTASESPETVLFPGYPQLMVGLTIASGLAQVSKIAGVQMFAEGTLDAPYTGKAIAHELGPELHFDENWNLKSDGGKGGAQFIDIAKGDKIIPADISEIIRKTMFASYGMKENQYSKFDYAEMGKYFDKSATKIVMAVNNQKPSSPNIIIQKDLSLRATFKGKRV